MSVFDTAMQALFADQNLAVTVTFIPQRGENQTVRVITRAPDLYQNIGQSVMHTPSLVLEVQMADCPTITPGDIFLIQDIKHIERSSESLSLPLRA